MPPSVDEGPCSCYDYRFVGYRYVFRYNLSGYRMHYYPVFLELSGRTCLVVGAGGVGCRKIATLLECPVRQIRVIDLAELDANLQALLEDERVSYTQRPFTPQDVEGCTLVFAATSSRETNDAVVKACADRGILCNCADAPKDSSFIVPALAEQGNISIALSTGGGSPALARKIREDLDAWLGERYAGISELLTRLRPLVLALRHETRQNTTLFRSLVDSPLSEALQRRDRRECESLLKELLPIELHPHIMELLHDLA